MLAQPERFEVGHSTKTTTHDLLTLLEELEAVGNAALVASKQETTTVLRLAAVILVLGQFWPELNTSSHDTAAFYRDRGNA